LRRCPELRVIVAAGDRIRIEHQYVIGYAWAALVFLPPLLVALVVMIQPWTFAIDLRVGRPAQDIGQFFAESFQRRTGKPLEIVAGDLPTAALISVAAPSRPSLYLESAPEYLPKVTRREIEEKGAVVVWPTADATGRPPAEVLRQFPNLVPEVAARVHAAVSRPHAADASGLEHDPAASAGRRAGRSGATGAATATAIGAAAARARAAGSAGAAGATGPSGAAASSATARRGATAAAPSAPRQSIASSLSDSSRPAEPCRGTASTPARCNIARAAGRPVCRAA